MRIYNLECNAGCLLNQHSARHRTLIFQYAPNARRSPLRSICITWPKIAMCCTKIIRSAYYISLGSHIESYIREQEICPPKSMSSRAFLGSECIISTFHTNKWCETWTQKLCVKWLYTTCINGTDYRFIVRWMIAVSFVFEGARYRKC